MKTYYTKKYFEERNELDLHLAETIKILMNKYAFKKILDVGCGTGNLVKFLLKNNFDAYGIDLSSEAVKFARKISKKRFIKANATKLPFKKNCFDLIVAKSLVEHLTKSEAKLFISEAKRILASGGMLLLVTPNFNSPLRLVQGRNWFGFSDPTHINFYTPEGLENLLKKFTFKKITFKFKTVYDPPYWDLPKPLNKLPKYIKSFITYLFISSPLSTYRDSFWISAQKP